DAAGHRLSPRLPAHDIEVHGDPLRLEQVLINLITNAIKYTREPGVVLISMELNGEDVMLAVADNGIGIAPEDLGKVFDMFTQVSGDAQNNQGGLGIGLSLVRDIVRLHDGHVEAA